MDPFNFANTLQRLYEARPDRDCIAQARQAAWFKRHTPGGRAIDGDQPVRPRWRLISLFGGADNQVRLRPASAVD